MYSKIAGLGMAAAMAVLISVPAFAGAKDWKVDSGHSYGEITTQTQISESQQSVTLGATRVIGTLRLDPQQIANSSFQFALDPQADSPDGSTYSVIRFRSRNAELTSEGKLRVTGDLTVTEVELDSQVEASEGYSGPQFTKQIVKETTHQQSFILALPSESQPAADISTEARISAEDFPELVSAVLHTNWPAISNDENYTPAGSVSEGYAGIIRTGSVIGERSINRTAISFSEDYPGAGAAVAQAGDSVTVALHLRLTQQGSASLASAGH